MKTKIQEIISKELGVAIERVTPEASFVDLGADSLEFVNLVVALEDAFKIQIPDNEARKLKTVQAVITFIEAHSES